MDGYLPETFTRFAESYAEVQEAYERLAERLNAAGPLTPRERRLVKLGIAIGRHSEGAMRSHTRKAVADGIEPEAIRHRYGPRRHRPSGLDVGLPPI